MYTVKRWLAYETEKETLLHAKKVKRRSQLPVPVKKRKTIYASVVKVKRVFFV